MALGDRAAQGLILLAAAAACTAPPQRSGDGGFGQLWVQPLIDFGQVAAPTVLPFAVRNYGNVPVTDLTLVDLTHDPAFTVLVAAPFVSPGEELSFAVAFADHDNLLVTEHHAAYLLQGSGAAQARFDVVGTAVFVDCHAPPPVDFGEVVVTDTARTTLTLLNPSPLRATVAVTGVAGVDAPDFALPDGPRSFDLAPGQSADVPLAFTPSALGRAFASVNVTLTSLCGPVTIALTGEGVDTVVRCGGESLTAFWAPPLSMRSINILFENRSFAPVALSELRLDPAATYALADAGPGLMLAPSSSTAVAVTFAPADAGLYLGTLSATTSNLKQPSVSCPLEGFGGGPRIDAQTPPVIDFGPVPAGEEQTRDFTLSNSGTSPDAGDARWNLFVSPLITPMTDGAFRASLQFGPMASLPQCDPVHGLAPGEGCDVPLLLRAGDAGTLMQWEVTFLSTDWVTPVTTLTVRAEP